MSNGKFLALLGVLMLIAANTLPHNSSAFVTDMVTPIMYGWAIGILICAILTAIMS